MLGNNLSFLVSVDVLLFDIVLYLVCHTSEDLLLWMMLKVVPGMSREFMAYGKYHTINPHRQWPLHLRGHTTTQARVVHHVCTMSTQHQPQGQGLCICALAARSIIWRECVHARVH